MAQYIVFRFPDKEGRQVTRAYEVSSPLLARGLQDWSGGRGVIAGLGRARGGPQADIWVADLTDAQVGAINSGAAPPPSPHYL